MDSQFKIPKFCINCEKEIKTMYDLGYEDLGQYLCKKCSGKAESSI